MYLRYFIAWFPLVILVLLNATIRQVVYARYVSELSAHQISTLTICVLVGIYTWALNSLWKLQSAGQAIGVGLMWMVLTIAFEFGFGRYVVGDSWGSLLHAYNVLEGRVWGLFILWVGLAPYVFYSSRTKVARTTIPSLGYRENQRRYQGRWGSRYCLRASHTPTAIDVAPCKRM